MQTPTLRFSRSVSHRLSLTRVGIGVILSWVALLGGVVAFGLLFTSFYRLEIMRGPNPGPIYVNAWGFSMEDSKIVINHTDWDFLAEGYIQGFILWAVVLAWFIRDAFLGEGINRFLKWVLMLGLIAAVVPAVLLGNMFDVQFKCLLFVTAIALTIQLAIRGLRGKQISGRRLTSTLVLSGGATFIGYVIGRGAFENQVYVRHGYFSTLYRLNFESGFVLVCGLLVASWLALSVVYAINYFSNARKTR